MLDVFQRIDDLLKEKKISQKELAQNIGLSSAQVFTNWKLRDSIPPADIACKIADFLGTTVEYLVTGEEKNPLQTKVDTLAKKLDRIAEIVAE